MASPFDDIPSVNWIAEKRFGFIENATVQQNVAVCFQYIVFLTVMQSLYKQGGAIALSINRDIVVHTASVVEACLHYGVIRKLDAEPSSISKLEKKWKRLKENAIHTFSDDKKIIWVLQEKIPQVYKGNPTSEDINKAALAIELLDNEYFNKAEKIRTARNHIHFVGPERHVAYPSSEEINKMFEDAKDILSVIEFSINPPF